MSGFGSRLARSAQSSACRQHSRTYSLSLNMADYRLTFGQWQSQVGRYLSSLPCGIGAPSRGLMGVVSCQALEGSPRPPLTNHSTILECKKERKNTDAGYVLTFALSRSLCSSNRRRLDSSSQSIFWAS